MVELMSMYGIECCDSLQRLFTGVAADSPFSEASNFGRPPESVNVEHMISLAIQGNSRESQYMEILSILHAMWNSSAYTNLSTLVTSENANAMLCDETVGLRRTARLVNAAINAKAWIAGDGPLMALAQQRIFQTIRGALSLSSPLCRTPLEHLLGGCFFVSGPTIPIPQVIWSGSRRKRYH